MKKLLDKVPSKHINNATVMAFVIGAVCASVAVNFLAKVDPSGMAGDLQDSICSDALAAVISDHNKQMTDCIGDKRLCEGKLHILQGD